LLLANWFFSSSSSIDAALLEVDQEHLAGLQAPLAHDAGSRAPAARRTREPMMTRSSSVTHVARRAQAVAVERGADLACRR
jgi:hypothetical protein